MTAHSFTTKRPVVVDLLCWLRSLRPWALAHDIPDCSHGIEFPRDGEYPADTDFSRCRVLEEHSRPRLCPWTTAYGASTKPTYPLIHLQNLDSGAINLQENSCATVRVCSGRYPPI